MALRPPPHATLPLAPEVDLEEVGEEQTADLFEVSFGILAPDYDPEVLTLTILIPQSQAEALEVVDTCRSQAAKDLFPVLCPIFPQPDPRWGHLLMIPAWPNQRAFICLDLTLWDGRTLAVASPPEVDKHILLNMAGLSGAAQVDVHIPGVEGPVPYGAEIVLETGMCVVFTAEPDAPRGPAVSLADMLGTPLAWAPPSDTGHAPLEDRYCLVTESLYCDFLLQPERAPWYRADIATRCGLSPTSVILSPASPQIEDASLYGRHCKTVIAVGHSPRRDAEQSDVVGLLDCRPILEGWHRLPSEAGRVDLEALRHMLDQAAPPGHHVHFAGCGRHWTWLWIDRGQVVRVSYEPDSHPGMNATGTAIASDDEAQRPSEPDDNDVDNLGGSLTHDTGGDAVAPYAPGAGSAYSVFFTAAIVAGVYGLAVCPPRSDVVWSYPPEPSQGAVCRTAPECFGIAIAVMPRSLGRPFALPWADVCIPSHLAMCPTGSQLDVSFLGDSLEDTPAKVCEATACLPNATNLAPRGCKILSEPTGSSSNRRGPVARARAAAHAFGDPWPYLRGDPRLTADRDGHGATQEVQPVTVPLAVCLLTPGHDSEHMTIQLSLPPHVGDVLLAIKAARHDFRSRVFPFVFLPPAQPLQTSLLAGAFPSWAVVDTFGVFDLTVLDRRLFVETVPSTISRRAILSLAKISEPTAVDIFLDDAAMPLADETEYPVHTGVLIRICPSAAGPRTVFTVPQVLRHATTHQSHPTFTPAPLGRHLCMVTETGHSTLSFPHDTLLPSPIMLPSLLGFPLNARICPARRAPDNVECWGYPCSAVLAVTDTAEGNEEPYVCLVDATELLQGWQLFTFGEEGLEAQHVHTVLETFMPPHWQLYLEGAEVEAGRFCCHDGHVIHATFVPEPQPGHWPPQSHEGDDSEPETDDDLMDVSDAESGSDGAEPFARNRSRTDRSSSPRRPLSENLDAVGCLTPCTLSVAQPATFRVILPLPPLGLAGRMLLLHSVIAAAGSPRAAKTGLSGSAHAGRPDYDHEAGESFIHGRRRIDLRDIPTPCRSSREPDRSQHAVPDGSRSSGAALARAIGPLAMGGACSRPALRLPPVSPGEVVTRGTADPCDTPRTLLEESLTQPYSPAFLAATLLDTLVEHFQQTPLTLSLGNLVPAAAQAQTADSSWDVDFWSDCSRELPSAPWSALDLPELNKIPAQQPICFGSLSTGLYPKQVLDLLQPPTRLATLGEAVCRLPQVDVTFLRAQHFQGSDFVDDSLHCFADGSFFKVLAGRIDVMAWACLFVCPLTGASGLVSGLVPSAVAGMGGPASAYVAECYALMIAVWVGATTFHHRPFCMRSDCQAAVNILQGTAMPSQSGAPALLRAMGSFCRAFCQFPPNVTYVPGHQGCLGNEVADRAVKQAAKGVPIGRSPCKGAVDPVWTARNSAALSWCGFALRALRGTPALPPCNDIAPARCDDALGMDQYQLVAPFLPPPSGDQQDRGDVVWGRLSVRLCSFNVLSLNSLAVEGQPSEGLAFKPARPTLLADRLRKAGAHVAFLQEARTEAGTLSSGGYLRFASGADNGTLGTEVWVREGFPCLRHPTDPARHVRFRKESFCVLHRDPRRLLLLFSQGPAKLSFCVCSCAASSHRR